MIQHSLQPVCDLCHQSWIAMGLCTLTFVEGKLHHLPIKVIFQGPWEIGCSRLQKWGNSTSGEKAVKKWAYHTSQRPRGFLVNVSWLKTCPVPELPLARTVHQH